MDTLLAQVDLKRQLYSFGGHPTLYNVSGPFEFISSILPNVYIIAAIILFLYLVFGGFTMVTAGANKQSLEQGQKIITHAIIGFIIIFTSYWIIQIIEVVAGVDLLNPNLSFF
jgi:hypothetical protein